MIEFLRHCFTGIDGQSWDLGRILWAIGVLAYIAYAGISLWHNKTPFDMQAYGIGFAAVLAAGGAALALKAKTEPQ